MKYKQYTGGTKEFVHPSHKLEDTKSSLDFKKSLYLSYFYKDPFDMTNVMKLKKMVSFYNLTLNMDSIVDINILFEEKKFVELTNKQSFDIELPKGEYKISFKKRIFLFFSKQKIIDVNLNKDKKIEITF